MSADSEIYIAGDKVRGLRDTLAECRAAGLQLTGAQAQGRRLPARQKQTLMGSGTPNNA